MFRFCCACWTLEPDSEALIVPFFQAVGEVARGQCLHEDSFRALVRMIHLLAVKGTVVLPEVLTAVGILLHRPPDKPNLGANDSTRSSGASVLSSTPRPLRHLSQNQFSAAISASSSASSASSHYRGSYLLARSLLRSTVQDVETAYAVARGAPVPSPPIQGALPTRATILAILGQPNVQRRLRRSFEKLDSAAKSGRIYAADFVTATREVRAAVQRTSNDVNLDKSAKIPVHIVAAVHQATILMLFALGWSRLLVWPFLRCV